MTIPKTIMQTWKDMNIPDKWKRSVESIREVLLPNGWRHILMTDEDNRNLIADNFPDFLETYDNFKYPIQRADAIRACYLYLYGGVYSDLDFEVKADFYELIEGHSLLFVPSGNIGTMFTNAFMVSKPKHEFWLEYIEEMKKPAPWYGIGKHMHVMTTTGPMALSRVIERTKYPYTILPSALFTPCSVCDLTCEASNSSYLVQLDGGSWNGADSLTYNWFMCNGWTVVLIIIIVIIIIILLAIS
ncbi:Glycosyltransferase sugar-binding region containing DXD motif protein [compost metagenome]